MATMKCAMVFLTFFVLVEAYNARHLHGVSIKESWPLSQVAVIQMVTGEEKLQLPQSTPLSSSYEQATYSQLVSLPPPLAPKGQATYGRVPIPPPLTPRRPPSTGQAAYVRVNPPPPPPIDDGPPPGIPKFFQEGSLVVEVSPKQDSSLGQTKYGQDDPRAQPSPDPNDSQVPGMYDQVNPSTPTITKPAHPKHPLLIDGGSACTGLSASTIDGRTNLSPPQAPFMLPSYITRVFKYWG